MQQGRRVKKSPLMFEGLNLLLQRFRGLVGYMVHLVACMDGILCSKGEGTGLQKLIYVLQKWCLQGVRRRRGL